MNDPAHEDPPTGRSGPGTTGPAGSDTPGSDITEPDTAGSVMLPCGRDALAVADEAQDGRLDDHVQTCPWCQGVVAAEADQRDIADRLRSAATPAPASLLPSVMATVWAELRPGRQIPLPTSVAAFVSELALSSAVQYALDRVPGMEVQVCRAALADPDDLAEPPVDGPVIGVEVAVALAYPADVLAMAGVIRRTAAATLRTQFGLAAGTVDVEVTDLYDLTGQP